MGRTILELFEGSDFDKAVDSKANESRGTVFAQIKSFGEQELTGVRVKSAVELNNPLIYGNEATRIALRSTPDMDKMKQDEGGGGLIGGTIKNLRTVVNSTLGVPQTLIPSSYTKAAAGGDAAGKLKGLAKLADKVANKGGTPPTLNDPALGVQKGYLGETGRIASIKQAGQGSFIGGLLTGGTPQTIAKQAAGNAIKAGKKELRKKLFGGGEEGEANPLKIKHPVIYDNTDGEQYSKAKTGDKIKEDIANQDFQKDGSQATNISYETPEAIAGKLRVGYSSAKPKITKGNYNKESGKTTFDKEEYNTDVVKKRTERIKDVTNELISKKGFTNKDDVINQSGIYTDEEKKIGDTSLDDYDFVPLKFQSVVTDETVNFRGSITGLSETVSPSWNSAKFSGNPFNFYTYDGVERSVSFNFTIYPMNSNELVNNWSKIGFLTSLTYPLGNPDIKSAYQSSIGSVRAPLLFFTLGDLYIKKESFIESLQYTVPDASTWQLDGTTEQIKKYESSGEYFDKLEVKPIKVNKGYKLPHMVEVAVTMKFLEQRRTSEKRENLYGFTPITYTQNGN
jgi:hypothetical protein